MSSIAMLAPVGPVSEAFIADESLICAIMGPYGSAKTTSCIRKIIQSPRFQNKGPDGVRRVRWCVVRDTYGQLETNVLNSWFTWFPKTKDNWNGREMVHRLSFDVALLDGNEPERWEIEVYFRAMGDQKAEDVLKGLELTGLWLNEVDTLDKGVLRFGLPRTGRYPSAAHGGCQYRAVIADFNAPDIDNWTYELLVEQKLPISDDLAAELRKALGPRFNIGFHRQPGGRSKDPLPENIRNLPDGYYESLMLGLTANDIRRFVDNEFGAVRNGQPVYPEYNDDIHCVPDLLPQRDLPMCLAVDGGSTPAAVFGQIDDLGRQRWTAECVVFQDDADKGLEQMGPEVFGRIVGEFWLEHYAHFTFGGAWADPAAFYGEDRDDYGWIKLFWKAFQKTLKEGAINAAAWKIKPAPCNGNRLPERLEAVRRPLTKMIGGQPALMISDKCRFLRRGFKNGYVILRSQLSNGSGRWADKPLKNDFSHVHDGGQYLALGLTKRGARADGDGRSRGRADGEQHRPRRRADFGSGQFAHKEHR